MPCPTCGAVHPPEAPHHPPPRPPRQPAAVREVTPQPEASADPGDSPAPGERGETKDGQDEDDDAPQVAVRPGVRNGAASKVGVRPSVRNAGNGDQIAVRPGVRNAADGSGGWTDSMSQPAVGVRATRLAPPPPDGAPAGTWDHYLRTLPPSDLARRQGARGQIQESLADLDRGARIEQGRRYAHNDEERQFLEFTGYLPTLDENTDARIMEQEQARRAAAAARAAANRKAKENQQAARAWVNQGEQVLTDVLSGWNGTSDLHEDERFKTWADTRLPAGVDGAPVIEAFSTHLQGAEDVEAWRSEGLALASTLRGEASATGGQQDLKADARVQEWLKRDPGPRYGFDNSQFQTSIEGHLDSLAADVGFNAELSGFLGREEDVVGTEEFNSFMDRVRGSGVYDDAGVDDFLKAGQEHDDQKRQNDAFNMELLALTSDPGQPLAESKEFQGVLARMRASGIYSEDSLDQLVSNASKDPAYDRDKFLAYTGEEPTGDFAADQAAIDQAKERAIYATQGEALDFAQDADIRDWQAEFLAYTGEEPTGDFAADQATIDQAKERKIYATQGEALDFAQDADIRDWQAEFLAYTGEEPTGDFAADQAAIDQAKERAIYATQGEALDFAQDADIRDWEAKFLAYTGEEPTGDFAADQAAIDQAKERAIYATQGEALDFAQDADIRDWQAEFLAYTGEEPTGDFAADQATIDQAKERKIYATQGEALDFAQDADIRDWQAEFLAYTGEEPTGDFAADQAAIDQAKERAIYATQGEALDFAQDADIRDWEAKFLAYTGEEPTGDFAADQAAIDQAKERAIYATQGEALDFAQDADIRAWEDYQQSLRQGAQGDAAPPRPPRFDESFDVAPSTIEDWQSLGTVYRNNQPESVEDIIHSFTGGGRPRAKKRDLRAEAEAKALEYLHQGFTQGGITTSQEAVPPRTLTWDTVPDQVSLYGKTINVQQYVDSHVKPGGRSPKQKEQSVERQKDQILAAFQESYDAGALTLPGQEEAAPYYPPALDPNRFTPLDLFPGVAAARWESRAKNVDSPDAALWSPEESKVQTIHGALVAGELVTIPASVAATKFVPPLVVRSGKALSSGQKVLGTAFSRDVSDLLKAGYRFDQAMSIASNNQTRSALINARSGNFAVPHQVPPPASITTTTPRPLLSFDDFKAAQEIGGPKLTDFQARQMYGDYSIRHTAGTLDRPRFGIGTSRRSPPGDLTFGGDTPIPPPRVYDMPGEGPKPVVPRSGADVSFLPERQAERLERARAFSEWSQQMHQPRPRADQGQATALLDDPVERVPSWVEFERYNPPSVTAPRTTLKPRTLQPAPEARSFQLPLQPLAQPAVPAVPAAPKPYATPLMVLSTAPALDPATGPATVQDPATGTATDQDPATALKLGTEPLAAPSPATGTATAQDPATALKLGTEPLPAPSPATGTATAQDPATALKLGTEPLPAPSPATALNLQTEPLAAPIPETGLNLRTGPLAAPIPETGLNLQTGPLAAPIPETGLNLQTGPLAAPIPETGLNLRTGPFTAPALATLAAPELGGGRLNHFPPSRTTPLSRLDEPATKGRLPLRLRLPDPPSGSGPSARSPGITGTHPHEVEFITLEHNRVNLVTEEVEETPLNDLHQETLQVTKRGRSPSTHGRDVDTGGVTVRSRGGKVDATQEVKPRPGVMGRPRPNNIFPKGRRRRRRDEDGPEDYNGRNEVTITLR